MEVQHRSLLHQHLLNLKRDYKPVPLILNAMSTESNHYLSDNSIGELGQEVSPTTVSPTTSMCSTTDNVSSSNIDMPSSMTLGDNNVSTERLCNESNDMNDEANVLKLKSDKLQFEKNSSDPFVVCIQYQDSEDTKCENVMVQLAEGGVDLMDNDEPMAKRIKTS